MLLGDEGRNERQHMPIVSVVQVQVADEECIIAGMGIANRGEQLLPSIAQVNGDLWKAKGKRNPRKSAAEKENLKGHSSSGVQNAALSRVLPAWNVHQLHWRN